jgi:NAD(P)H-dependent flavin oxidoreductase YrpB (nitropropane dioxygenase family)
MAIPNRQLKPETIELLKAGASFSQIATQLQYADESGARKAVKALLEKREYESVDEMRKMELERLDKLLLGTGGNGVYQQAIKGHLSAIDRVVKIMERRAKLLGLDAPTKVDAKVAGTLKWEDVVKTDGDDADTFA